MRKLIIAFVIASISHGAWAQSTTAKVDPQDVPESSAESAVTALLELTKKLEAAGFKDVQVVPQAVLVHAKDKFDKPILMIVDAETMMAVEIQNPSETTGSGSNEN